MLCQICKKNPATIELHLQGNGGGDQKVLLLCPECARKKSAVGKLLKEFNMPEVVSRITEDLARSVQHASDGFPDALKALHEMLRQGGRDTQDQNTAEEEPAQDPLKKCPCCGWTLERLNMTEKLGCEECYQTFREEILERLPNVSRSRLHVGRVPPVVHQNASREKMAFISRTEEEFYLRRELADLRKSLQEAVRREEYGQAAELRDKVRDLEHELSEGYQA